MEDIFSYVCANAQFAGLILFSLLIASGFNVPISEDIILITAGALSATCLSEEFWVLYLSVFAGCWFSSWIAYWIGRTLGPKLYDIGWFNWAITPKRIRKLHEYYEKFGALTFVVGRLFPGGIRNALFMSAGMGKMPFPVFILRDFLAVSTSSSLIFYLGYIFGQNYQLIIDYFLTYNRIVLGGLIVVVLSLLISFWLKHRSKSKKI